MNINTLLESANPYKSLQDDAGRLAGKWKRTGLLEGFKSETEANNMSMILENQAKQLVVEASATGGTANFTAGTGETWAGVALPLVRKVFGEIAAKEFVSVQPMNLPSGLVFYLDFQYGTDKDPFTLNGSMYGDTSANFGNTNTGGLYGAGRFTYSSNQFSSSIVPIVSGSQFQASGTSGSIETATWADVEFSGQFSASAAAGTISKVTVPNTNLTRPDILGVKGFVCYSGSFVGPSVSELVESDQLMQYSTTSGSGAGQASIFIFNNLTTAGLLGSSSMVVEYNAQPTDNTRGDFEEDTTSAIPNAQSTAAGSADIVIPEINVQLSSEAIVAKTKKLKAVWTPEFAQDLNAYHSLDAEAELTSIMSEYISLEIDLEILSMLIESAAAGTEVWSAENNVGMDTTGITAADLGFYNTQGGWFQTLGTKIQKVSNLIHQKTLRGGANFIVVSPTVGTIIESIPGFVSNSDGDAAKAKYAFGVQKAGQMNGRYNVYKNPYMIENVILVGYRGSQFLETGAVFAPYIPLIMTPLVYDPNTFVPRKGLLTRYAKKMVRPEFYGKILISGLNTI